MKTDESGKSIQGNQNTEAGKIEKAKKDAEKKIRDEGLKKGIITTSIISFIVLLIAGIIGYSVYSRDQKSLIGQMEEQKTSLTDKVTARDSVISEWITTFDEIEKNIALIKEKEKMININSSNTEISKDIRLHP